MFYSHQLLARKAPLGQIWMAATLHAKINRRKLDKLNIIKICEEILNPTVPMALRLSGILMGGVVIVYERKVKLLYDDVNRFLVEINEAWKVKATVRADPTMLPKSRAQAKYKSVTLPEPEVFDLTAAMEQSLNISNSAAAAGFQQQPGEYFTMQLDRIDDIINNDIPREENHHQADLANITLLDPFESYQADPSQFNRFERFDIEGDEDIQVNFPTQDHSRIPSLVPSPPHQEASPQEVLLQEELVGEVGPEQQNNQQSDERREEVQLAQQNKPKPRETRRRAGPKANQMDYEQTIIPGSVYQSWLQDPSDIVAIRGSEKNHLKPMSSLKPGHLMELPPVALFSGISGFATTEIYYPKPFLDLYMKCTKQQTPQSSSPSQGRDSHSPPQPPGPASPSVPNQHPKVLPGPASPSVPNQHPTSVEDVHSGVGSHPKQVSIEKQMENLNIFEFPVNEFNMSFTPGNSGGNERTVPSSASGNGLMPPVGEEPLELSNRKRAHSSSKHRGSIDLDPVAEENPMDLPEPIFKLRRLSEIGVSYDEEMLMETGPTPTQHPLVSQPVDKMTDVVRKHLKTHFDTPGTSEIESLNQLASGMNAKKAALLFYQTCVLATHNYLKVRQEEPYGDILISKGPKM